jgi:hypothetical protein
VNRLRDKSMMILRHAMRRIFLALFLLVFAAAHVAAAPAGLCRHASPEAHASALSSENKDEAHAANLEEAAADIKLKTMSDKVSAGLAVGVLPDTWSAALGTRTSALQWLTLRSTPLPNQLPQPPLNPPSF